MPRYKQSAPNVGLSVERGTESVPDDGLYHVLLDGKVILASKSEREALAVYRRVRDSLLRDQPRASDGTKVTEALRRAAAEREADAFLAQSTREKRARATRRGGPGGSGGVGG